MIKKASILILILYAITGLAVMADAKLVKIGTATIKNIASGPQGGGDMMTGMPGGQSGAREYKLIYEDDQGLIWLDYTNSRTSWFGQVEWAAGLNGQGAVTIKLDPGVSVVWDGDWRLPKSVDSGRTFGYDGTTTAGFNITSSELGHLFYKSLGNQGYYDTKGNQRDGWYPDSTWGLQKKGPFENLQTGNYWSGTEYSPLKTHAWAFSTAFGEQSCTSFKGSYPYMGIAVRQGKVAFPAGQEK
ncbi:MAG: hypothetical protein JW944_07590 [Deltaproteobacteria bacterium]|nr:hypothetical protein [Deltaproteobacteria bacterium]